MAKCLLCDPVGSTGFPHGGTVMPELTDELRRVLDALPAEPEPERSRLDPFRAYILRWRREGRSYRQIQSILQNQCGVRIAYGPLRRFVIRKSRPRKRVDVETEPQTAEPVTVKKSPEPAVKADRWAAERERMRHHKGYFCPTPKKV